MDRGLKVSLESYSKIFLHAAKYPECPILGFVIGNEVNKEVKLVVLKARKNIDSIFDW